MPPFVILGAGLAGLGCARELPGAVIFEAKDHSGGHVSSHEQHGVYFDEGAHICHAKDPEWRAALCRNAGRVVDVAQSRVANFWHGRWITYPVQNHLRDLPPEERIQALSDLVSAQVQFQGQKPAHYGDWIRFQYGVFLAERFYKEYTDKYWRTPMEQMDTDWLSGRLLPSQLPRIVHGAIAPLDEKQSVFSNFLYPERGGFHAFFKPFADGLDIRLGAHLVEVDARVKRVRFADGRTADYDRLVSTIPLPDLVAAIKDAPDAVRAAARALRHTQLLCVNMIVGRPALCPHHWFYVYDSDIDVARVKVMSNLTPAGCPPDCTVLQTEIFRRDDETMDFAALQNKAVGDMARVLGFDPSRDVRSVDRVHASHAYPIPLLGRARAVDSIVGWLAQLDIFSTGLYGRWKYLWSDEAFKAGQTTGRQLAAG